MCVYTKKPYSTLAEYGHTLYSKLSTLLSATPFGCRSIALAYATQTPKRTISKRTFDHKPVHLQANNTKHRGRSSDLFRLERLPNFLSGRYSKHISPKG